jgi:hypothetical protein
VALALLVAGIIAAGFGHAPHAAGVLRRVTFRDDFQSGKLDAWLLPHPEDWEVRTEGTLHYLHMKRSREPGVPRRPLQFALLQSPRVGSFELETRVRREGRSLIVVFNYVDTLHFYYLHLSVDRGTEQPVHNGVFIVYNGPRERIAGTEAPPALPDRDWHEVRLVRDVARGAIQAFLDHQKEPLFSAHSLMLKCGQVGLGSFDETGDFADVKLTTEDAGCESKETFRPANKN